MKNDQRLICKVCGDRIEDGQEFQFEKMMSFDDDYCYGCGAQEQMERENEQAEYAFDPVAEGLMTYGRI